MIPAFETGEFSFETVKPGTVSGPDGHMAAPHINLWLVSRGINIGLNTRMYFQDEDVANNADPILNLVEQADRRKTLIATGDGREERDARG